MASRKGNKTKGGTKKPGEDRDAPVGVHQTAAGRGRRLVVGVRPVTPAVAEREPLRAVPPAPALQGARVRDAFAPPPPTSSPARRLNRACRAMAASRQAWAPPWGPPSSSGAQARGASPHGHPPGPSNSGSQGGAGTSCPPRTVNPGEPGPPVPAM